MKIYVIINLADHNGDMSCAQIEKVFKDFSKAKKYINGREINYSIQEWELQE